MWEAAKSRIQLPAGTTYEDFQNGIDFYFPQNYNCKEGLQPEEIPSFWLACFTLSYIHENYGQEALISQPMLTYILTADQINEYIYYQYNDTNFDATKLDKYDNNLGGILHISDHGGLVMRTHLRISTLLPNGDMELYFDIASSVLEFGGVATAGTYYAHIRPTKTPTGDIIYTLLESRPLTPLPAIQELHFSV